MDGTKLCKQKKKLKNYSINGLTENGEYKNVINTKWDFPLKRDQI